jgi:DNA-binding CsgD family transcriptional regulator
MKPAENIIRFFCGHRTWTSTEIGEAIGLEASYVRKVLSRNGLRLMRSRHRRGNEIAELIAAGKGTREIAAELGIRPQTIYKHTKKIRIRTGARNNADIARITILAGRAA